MPKRYVSEDQLAFTVMGRPLCCGNSCVMVSGERVAKSFRGGAESYKALIRLSAKAAMAEQGWKMTDEGVYVVITLYLGHGVMAKPNEKKLAYSNAVTATRLPTPRRITDVVMQVLRGLVFRRELQVVGLLVVKKYDRDERMDVLVGTAKNFKELVHDLRNA